MKQVTAKKTAGGKNSAANRNLHSYENFLSFDLDWPREPATTIVSNNALIIDGSKKVKHSNAESPPIGKQYAEEQKSAIKKIQKKADKKTILSEQPKPLKENLSQSFELFIKTSNELADAYNSIQDQLAAMQIELHQTQQQRLDELERKEVLSARLENLLNVLPCGVIVLDGGGLIQTINPYGREIFNRIELGERWIDVINREFSPQADDGHEISLINGKRVSIETRSLVQEPGQIISISDLTENRQLQKELARHQRLSEMGKMLASLAHQIRTPLSAAILYGSQLENPSLEDATRSKIVSKMQGRLGCINQQIKDLLVFVRGGVELDEMISLEVLLHSLKKECEILLAASHSVLELRGVLDNGWLLVNRQALVGALCNLIENSIHAVISHGHIVIEVSIEYRACGDRAKGNQGAGDQAKGDQASRDQIIFHVTDNGPGISDQNKVKIMEPFFTTKSTGTGLGLSVVQATVRAHGGEFSLDRQIKEGAGFIIQLPLYQIDPEEA